MYQQSVASAVPQQEVLARNLVDHLGYREALDLCRNNYWDGVLSWVLTMQSQPLARDS